MSKMAALLWALGFSAFFVLCLYAQMVYGGDPAIATTCDGIIAACAIGFWLMWLSKRSRDADYAGMSAMQEMEEPAENSLYRDRTKGSTRMIPRNFK